jgi:CBS domain-containing protein
VHANLQQWRFRDESPKRNASPITELAKLMRQHEVGSIAIGENDRLIGMVTDRDVVCKGLAQKGFDARSAAARDVTTEASIAAGRTMTSPRRCGTWRR